MEYVNQLLRLISDENKQNLPTFEQLKLIEKFYQSNSSLNIPLIVILWPGDCAHVTHDLIDYINNSNFSY